MSRSPFGGHRPPAAPPELRGRVLETCAAGLAVEQRPGWLDRLWQSRRLRRVWLASVAVLALANVLALGGSAGERRIGQRVVADRRAGLEEAVPSWWRPPRSGALRWADAHSAATWPGLELD